MYYFNSSLDAEEKNDSYPLLMMPICELQWCFIFTSPLQLYQSYLVKGETVSQSVVRNFALATQEAGKFWSQNLWTRTVTPKLTLLNTKLAAVRKTPFWTAFQQPPAVRWGFAMETGPAVRSGSWAAAEEQEIKAVLLYQGPSNRHASLSVCTSDKTDCCSILINESK